MGITHADPIGGRVLKDGEVYYDVNTALFYAGNGVAFGGQALAVVVPGAANTFTLGPQTIQAGAAANKVLIVQAAAGQTADLEQWQSSAAAVLFAIDSLGRPYTGNTTPTIVAGTGAGTSPTVSLSGTDTNGVITVTTGTSPATSATIATITFSAARANAPKTVHIAPAEANAGALSGATQVVATAAGISTTAFTLTSGSSALTASTTYKWYYWVLG